MFDTRPVPLDFIYNGALYLKGENGCIRFTGYEPDRADDYGRVTLSDAVIDKASVKGTPLWKLIYDPDFDITTIRVSGSVVKIKKYFLKENEHSEVFLSRDKLLIRIIITNGDISEYELLPGRMGKRQTPIPQKKGSNRIAWLFSNNKNLELYHERIWEGGLC